MTRSGMLHRLDSSKFYSYELLLFQIFVPWKFVKPQAFPCLLLLLQSTATQITISTNIFICLKYYIALSQSAFLLGFLNSNLI